VRIENPQLAFASDGVISSRRTDITFDASLADLALIDPRLQGAVNARGQAQGDGLPVAVTASISVPSGQVMGRELTNARVAFDGEVRSASDFSGTLDGTGGLDGLVLSLAGQADVSGQERSLSGLEVRVGPNRLTGDLQQSGSGPAAGTVTLDAPDIAPLAALALTEASGAVNAQVDLIASESRQDVDVDAQMRSLAAGATRVGQLDLTANVRDALNVPMIDGRLSARDIAAGGIEIATLGAEATQTDPTHMKFSAQSRLVVGTLADLSGELERLDNGFAVNLDTLRLSQQDVSATLTQPATISLRGGAVELSPLTLDFGTGRLTAQGKMNDSFDIAVDITDMPLALGNAIKPDLALAGVVNGSARVTGPRNAPNVSFDVTAADVAASATRTAGLPPVTLTATGTTSNGDLALDATLASGNGLSADARGSVPLGAGNLDLTVDLNAFPLALVDRIAGNQGLQGTISGLANVTGPLADPAVTFDVRGDGLTANPMSASGLPPVNLSANGAYRGQVVTIESASASGAGGLDLTGSGRIPLTGSGLDVNVSGTAPLAMANPLLEQRAAQAEGTLRIDATARGSLTAPQLGGNVSLNGGTFVDPGVNIRLEGIALDAGLEGDAAVLRSFSANVATGGRISADGRVSINSAAGFPADLNARIDNVRYTDGAMVSTQVSGQLGLQGPLVGGGGLLSGQIDLGRTEISISEGLGGSSAVLEQVNHVNTPQGVQTTLDRAGLGTPATEETTPSQPSPGIGLDIQINAPNQIFVRGRGLDVEVGGSVRIQGTTNDIQPVGQFDLRRGRLLVLTQRIEFDEGSVQLVGNLDPLLNFVAHTRSGDVTAIVTVTGRASAPEIGFSSEPPLPEDEVLARLLFNRAAEDLSPFQLAQLAAAAAELAGAGGGPGVMSQLRNATGLDDLDVITDEQGDTALRAGKYLSENIYLDVQTDTAGMSQAEINLDISDSVTARGSVASDGNTTIGLFYERDF
jgi:translocation and assembly module TamB